MKRNKRLASLAKQVAPSVGCSSDAAVAAMDQLVRAGLVAVRGGRVVLPLAPVVRTVGGQRES